MYNDRDYQGSGDNSHLIREISINNLLTIINTPSLRNQLDDELIAKIESIAVEYARTSTDQALRRDFYQVAEQFKNR